jgi:uncharacterized protein YcfL
MKKLFLFTLITLFLTSCNTVLLITPGDVFIFGVIYIVITSFMALACSSNNDLKRQFFLNLFLTPIYGLIYLKWKKRK